MSAGTYQSSIFRHMQKGSALLGEVVPSNNSLFAGKLGQILYLGYSYKLTGEEQAFDRMLGYIDEILESFRGNNRFVAKDIAYTLPNLCFVLKVLKEDNIIDVDLGEEDLAIFDELIFNNARIFIKNKNIDFLFGAAGCLHYLAARLQANAKVQDYLNELLEALDKTGIADERGLRFYNSHVNQQNQTIEIDLGLAHGQCGLLLVLLEIVEAGGSGEKVKALCMGIIRFISGLRMQPDRASGFPSFYPVGVDETIPISDPVNRAKYNNRMGWCYGDLNVALAFYRAARLFDDVGLMELADEVALDACTRTTHDDCGISSAHICHGSSSLVLVYRALFQERPLLEFLDAKEYWQQYTQDLLEKQLETPDEWARTTEFLMGVPGALLTLISDVLPERTAWEKIFLM